MNASASAVNWGFWLVFASLTLAVPLAILHTARRRRALGRIYAALLLLSALPLWYASAIWTGVLDERFLRLERHWLAWLPSLASFWLWLRCVNDRPEDTRPERALRDACFVLGTWLGGLVACGLAWGRPLDRMVVVALLDQSRSTELVPNVEQRLARELTSARTSMRDGDQLGVLVFGANALVQSPPSGRDQLLAPAELPVIRDGTDVERALRRGLAELPADAAGKLVLLSDGVATRGDASNAVAAAVAAGVPIDVVPLEQAAKPNVRVVKLSGPASVSDQETFELRVVVESPEATEVWLEELEDGRRLRQGAVEVRAGQTVLSLKQHAESPGLHRFEVRVSVKDPKLDQLREDNQRVTFVRVRGRTTALLLNQGASETPLAAALRAAGLEVSLGNARSAPSTSAGWLAHDLLVLEDLPAHAFTNEKLQAIEHYVRVGGGGLLLMGSPETLGPGGYSRTPIENVSPVSFDLKQDRRRGQLSQVIVIDVSGSMAAQAGPHTKLDLANEGAVRSAALLGADDRLAVAHADTQAHWTLAFGDDLDERARAERIRGVRPGGGGIIVEPALRAAYAALVAERSALQHVLLFADGSDAEELEPSIALARAAHQRGVTTSVIALGTGKDLPLLERLSEVGKGRFYLVADASRLPSVFAQETITAARAAVREEPFAVTAAAGAGVLRGIDFDEVPALGGYVVSLARSRALVSLRGPDADPILASWSAGLGRTAVFSSDYGGRWGGAWTTWPAAAQLFAQLGRSLARAQDDTNARLEASVRDGQLHLSVDALTEDGKLDAFRNLSAQIGAPDGRTETTSLHATGAGRYTTTRPLEMPGSHLISIVDTASNTLVATTAVEFGSGDELRPGGSDRTSLRRIAEESGGVLRETLAGLFGERLSPRREYVDLTPHLAIAAALIWLLGVAARQLRGAWLPVPASWREPSTRAPEALTLRDTPPARGPTPAAAPERAVTAGSGAAPAGPSVAPSSAELLLARRRERARSSGDRARSGSGGPGSGS